MLLKLLTYSGSIVHFNNKIIHNMKLSILGKGYSSDLETSEITNANNL